MSYTIGNIRTFQTKNFKVIVDAIEDEDLDLSFDETGETYKQIENGSLIAFCARVRVVFRPTDCELGSDYLGQCIYASIADFQDHRQPENHGSYFAGMIREAISNARHAFKQYQNVRLR